jgi:hypothetical protein
MNILAIYGNGGSDNWFVPVIEKSKLLSNRLVWHVPTLSGFDQKALPESDDYWDTFLNDIYEAVEGKTLEPWVFYAYGSGVGFLLELAARKWTFPNGYILKPRHVVLHAPDVPSYEISLMSRIIDPDGIKMLKRKFKTVKFLQKHWEKKLFVNPEEIDPEIRQKFFRDIKNCPSYKVILDMMDDIWYRRVQSMAWHQQFDIVWSGQDHSGINKQMERWRRDFPKSDFHLVQDWTRYPMLDSVSAFLGDFRKICSL